MQRAPPMVMVACFRTIAQSISPTGAPLLVML
jgi:hypothetical protein